MKPSHWVGIKPKSEKDNIRLYPEGSDGFGSREEALEFRKHLIRKGIGQYRLVYLVAYEAEEKDD